MRRTSFRALPLAAAVAAVVLCGIAIAGPANTPATADSGAPRVVEAVRYATQGDYMVEVRFLIDLDRVPDPEAAADLAMGASPGDGTVTAQYKVGKRKWASGSLPVQVQYNPAGSGSNPSAAAAIESAIGQWNAVTPSTFSFAYTGTSGRTPGACADTIDADGFNTVSYADDLPVGVLGRTCTLFKSGNSPILEFDMKLDSGTAWSVAASTPRGKFDLTSTIVHELGHAAGISHPCEKSADCSAAEKLSVMFPYLYDGDQRRTVTEDDKGALRALYPGGPVPTPGPTPVSVPPFDRAFSAVAVSLARD